MSRGPCATRPRGGTHVVTADACPPRSDVHTPTTKVRRPAQWAPAEGIARMSIPWFFRLPRRALARRDVIERMARELHRERKVDPGDALHAFGFKCDELAFARDLLVAPALLALFERTSSGAAETSPRSTCRRPTSRAARCGCSSSSARSLCALHCGAGLQLANAESLRAAIAADTGLVAGCAAVERVTGDARVIARWLGSA